MNKDLEIVREAILKRADYKDWYVLRYNLKTTEYNNEIVFKTYNEAVEEFKNSLPNNEDERVELIFAPEKNDKEFFDNILIAHKTIDYKLGEASPIMKNWQLNLYQKFF